METAVENFEHASRSAVDAAVERWVDTPAENTVGGAWKRFLDVSLAICAAIILLPVMLIVAFLIFAQDGRTPIYGHRRVGRRGQTFRCLKFRSMTADSDALLVSHLAGNPNAALEWAHSQKLQRDPRVTPIGRILRTSSLDELPQLFNVLAGDMSLVGPRPIVVEEISRYGADFERYCACRPGITGIWQVSGRSDCSYTERVRLDADYTRQWSFKRDLIILLKTVPVVIGRKGSA